MLEIFKDREKILPVLSCFEQEMKAEGMIPFLVELLESISDAVSVCCFRRKDDPYWCCYIVGFEDLNSKEEFAFKMRILCEEFPMDGYFMMNQMYGAVDSPEYQEWRKKNPEARIAEYPGRMEGIIIVYETPEKQRAVQMQYKRTHKGVEYLGDIRDNENSCSGRFTNFVCKTKNPQLEEKLDEFQRSNT